MTWSLYRKTGITEMRPYRPDEDLTGISVSPGGWRLRCNQTGGI